ncbi:restriction endonuclease subunit S [Frankia sp. Cpl3]|nr:restriction endonuclease subunit S [Frankia sp. Cpl3]
MSDWPEVTLGDVMSLDLGTVEVEPDATYDIVGVLNRGRGLLRREPMPGSDTAYKNLNVILPRQVVYSRLKAFEGAITVVPDDAPRSFASQEFPTFTCGPDLLPEYFALHTTTTALWERLQGLSTGMGGRRERVKPADFLTIRIPLPPLAEQRRIVDLAKASDDLVAFITLELVEARTVLATLRAKLGATGDKIPLSEMATSGGIQIGPFGSQLHANEYTDDPTGIPVVMPQDLVDGEIVTTEIKRVPEDVAVRLARHRLRAGDIVFPRRGNLTKRALVTDKQEGWLCGTGCLRFRAAEGISTERLSEALAGKQTSEWLVEHAVGSTMLNLNTQILSRLPVADITNHPELADASMTVLSSIRALVSEATALRAVRSALVSELITGAISISKSYDRFLAEVA